MHDALVIGAGFFGIEIALELKRIGFESVLLVEREPGVMRRASFVNQARVHNGYHYPRSLATAERSKANFETFVADYADAIMPGTESIYAIARGSRVSGAQFETFCRTVGVRCQMAPRRISQLFDGALIEEAFMARELTFDALRLAARLAADLRTAGVDLRLESKAKIVRCTSKGVAVDVNGVIDHAAYVFNCTYAGIRSAGVLLHAEVRQEMAELVLIVPPPELRNLGITVMDGPFFSTLPFPSTHFHSLSHVRYTPQAVAEAPQQTVAAPSTSNAPAIMRDSQRYLPCLARAEVVGSLFEVKATLQRNVDDDGRPILIERSPEMPRVLSVLGAKIDNIYDVRRFLRGQDWQMAA